MQSLRPILAPIMAPAKILRGAAIDDRLQLLVNWGFGMFGMGAFLLLGRGPAKGAKTGLLAATGGIGGPCSIMGVAIRSFGCYSRGIILNNCLYSQYLFYLKRAVFCFIRY